MSFRISAADPPRIDGTQIADAAGRGDTSALADDIETLLHGGYAPLVAGAALAAVLALAYQWAGGSGKVLPWLGALVGASALVALHVAVSRRAAAARAPLRLPAMLLLATAWGAAALWLAPSGLAPAVVLAATLVAVAVAGACAHAADRLAMYGWLALVLGPLTVVLLRDEAVASKALGALVATLLAAAAFLASRQNALLLAARRTRLANDALVNELRQQVFLVERANREKSRFLAAASHDLRQPMHAMGLFAAALEKSLSRTPLQHTVTNMMRAVDALEQSFSAMLDISKLDAGVIEPNLQSFPIRDLFRRLHMQCAGQAEELGLGLRFKPGGKLVTSDPQLLERVLGNLIHNAIRYTRQGGVVVVARTRRLHTSIEVWDSGIGIAEDELPKVFDEFYQVDNSARDRARGLGMGLAIVKRLVLLMGHELEVKSSPGRGTVFRILLEPTEMAEMDNVVLSADTVPSPIDANQTVLLIDDEESIRIGMRELLQTWGYEVLLAASIGEACTEVRRHAGVIDLVISDLRLANHEDGIDAIGRVRRVYGAPLPAVLITGDTSAEEVKRAHESGHRVLFKPVRTRELYAALRSAP